MREITTKVYSFNELSERAQARAIEQLFDINVDHDWWEFVYDDAERAHLKISHFDIGRSWSIGIQLASPIWESVTAILNEHGKDTTTHTIASKYRDTLNKLKSAYTEQSGIDYDDAMVKDGVGDEETAGTADDWIITIIVDTKEVDV